MGKVYSFLGLTVGLVIPGMDNEDKKAAYNADITYCTNNELGFLIMCATILLIAITGFLYFSIQEKKGERRHAN